MNAAVPPHVLALIGYAESTTQLGVRPNSRQRVRQCLDAARTAGFRRVHLPPRAVEELVDGHLREALTSVYAGAAPSFFSRAPLALFRVATATLHEFRRGPSCAR